MKIKYGTLPRYKKVDKDILKLMSPIQRKVHELRQKGLTYKVIGEKLGFSKQWANIIYQESMGLVERTKIYLSTKK